MVTQTDLIKDLLQRVAQAAPTVSADVLAGVEADVRRDWNGERVYVSQATPNDKATRNSRIMRAYLSNVRLAEIARLEGLTVRRTLQIIKRR